MSTHNICFYGEIREIIPELSPDTPPYQVPWLEFCILTTIIWRGEMKPTIIMLAAQYMGICIHWKPRSTCTYAQSNQSFHYLQTESLDTTECMNGEQRPGWYFAHAEDDLNLILCVLKGTFSLKRPMYVWHWHTFQTSLTVISSQYVSVSQ